MTRAEKLAAVDAKYNPIIETRQQAVSDARINLNNKEGNLEEKQIEYKNKIAAVNEYYDALEAIARLQLITEPEV